MIQMEGTMILAGTRFPKVGESSAERGATKRTKRGDTKRIKTR